MSDTGRRAIVFWLSGAYLADIRTIPEVEALMKRGASVELIPAPITGTQSRHYQLMTGRRPDCFGFFDTLTLRGYKVVEELQGKDIAPPSLIDLLKAADWTVSNQDMTIAGLVAGVKKWAQTVTAAASFLIVKCSMPETVTEKAATALAEALRVAQSVVGDDGLLAIVSTTQPFPAKHFVNLNNFLRDMGVIGCNENNGSIDWSNTLAHYMGHGQLWINVQGRDSQGIVTHQDEYEEVRQTLIKALPVKVRDPQTDEEVIERIYRKEELYHSDYLFCAPDLVVVFKPGYVPSPKSTLAGFDDTIFTPVATATTVLEGTNPTSGAGFLVVASPAFVQGTTLSSAAPLTAVAPTLLHALEVQHGVMDSTALSDCFVPYYLDLHPIKAISDQPRLSSEEEELVINRLRDLGYI